MPECHIEQGKKIFLGTNTRAQFVIYEENWVLQILPPGTCFMFIQYYP